MGEPEPSAQPWAELWMGAHPRGPSRIAGGEASLVERIGEVDGIPRDAPHRNYRDPSAKPELLCALEPFEALCGFDRLAERPYWYKIVNQREGGTTETVRRLFGSHCEGALKPRRAVRWVAVSLVRARSPELGAAELAQQADAS